MLTRARRRAEICFLTFTGHYCLEPSRTWLSLWHGTHSADTLRRPRPRALPLCLVPLFLTLLLLQALPRAQPFFPSPEPLGLCAIVTDHGSRPQRLMLEVWGDVKDLLVGTAQRVILTQAVQEITPAEHAPLLDNLFQPHRSNDHQHVTRLASRPPGQSCPHQTAVTAYWSPGAQAPRVAQAPFPEWSALSLLRPARPVAPHA